MDTQELEKQQVNSVMDQLSQFDHEQVVHCYDEAT